MTPKEKAIDLVEKIGNIKLYIDIEPRNIEGNIKYFDKDLAKQCALIAVDEIMEEHYPQDIKRCDYWQKVKQEIQNL